MNISVFIAGLVAAFTMIGHFTIGSRLYLRPMLNASFDAIPKKVMHCVFHYVSVFQVLSTMALVAVGIGGIFRCDTRALIQFISLNYAMFAVVQLILALSSAIKDSVFKMFQWILFLIIAVCAWLGA